MAWEMEPWEKSDREGIACVNTIRLLCPGGKAGAARPMLHRWMKIYEDKEECAAKKGGYTQIYSYFNILPNLALGGNMGLASWLVARGAQANKKMAARAAIRSPGGARLVTGQAYGPNGTRQKGSAQRRHSAGAFPREAAAGRKRRYIAPHRRRLGGRWPRQPLLAPG